MKILTEENKSLKQKLKNTIQNIQTHEEYIELERKYKSYESYVVNNELIFMINNRIYIKNKLKNLQKELNY